MKIHRAYLHYAVISFLFICLSTKGYSPKDSQIANFGLQKNAITSINSSPIGKKSINPFGIDNDRQKSNNTNLPNVLMITVHDLGQHIGSYGVETVETPHLDRLAEKGIRFSNFYSTSGVCSPGRASLLTGTSPQTNGLLGLTHAPWWWSLAEEARSWHMANIFKKNGYTTYLIGLQHVIQRPVEGLGYEFHLSKEIDAERTAEKTVELIQKSGNSENPFFAKVGFSEVHRPFSHGADSSKGIFVPEYLKDTQIIRSDLAKFQAEIKYMDNQIGKILDALYRKENVANNTIVIFTSDHGIPYPGAKWTVRKAGIEVPFIIYRRDSFLSGGKVYKQIMSNVDVLPTLLDAVGIGTQNQPQLEGVSFYNFLKGTTDQAPRQMAFSQYTPDMKRDNLSRSVITKRYHLIRYFDQGRSVDYPTDTNPQKFIAHIERMKTKGSARPFVQLYDIKKDPFELHNIADEPKYRQVVQELSQELLNWMKRVDDQLLQGPLKTPYYEKAIQDLYAVGGQ